MGKRCKDPGVRCPFYCSEDASKIYCEGPEPDNWIHRAWGDGKKKKLYKKQVCKGNWGQCPVAAMLEVLREG